MKKNLIIALCVLCILALLGYIFIHQPEDTPKATSPIDTMIDENEIGLKEGPVPMSPAEVKEFVEKEMSGSHQGGKSKEEDLWIDQGYRSLPEYETLVSSLEALYWASKDPLKEGEVTSILDTLQQNGGYLLAMVVLDFKNGTIPGLTPEGFSETKLYVLEKAARLQMNDQTREGLYSLYKSSDSQDLRANVVTFSDFSLNHDLAQLHMGNAELEIALAVMERTVTSGDSENLARLIQSADTFSNNRESYESMVLDLVSNFAEPANASDILSVYVDDQCSAETRDLALRALQAHPDKESTKAMLEKIGESVIGSDD